MYAVYCDNSYMITQWNDGRGINNPNYDYLVFLRFLFQNGCADEYLFDPVILKQIDFSKHKATYKPMISPANPGESLLLRPLCLGDFDRGKT